MPPPAMNFIDGIPKSTDFYLKWTFLAILAYSILKLSAKYGIYLEWKTSTLEIVTRGLLKGMWHNNILIVRSLIDNSCEPRYHHVISSNSGRRMIGISGFGGQWLEWSLHLTGTENLQCPEPTHCPLSSWEIVCFIKFSVLGNITSAPVLGGINSSKLKISASLSIDQRHSNRP